MDAHTTYASDYLRRCVELLVAGRADNVGGPYRTATTGRRHRAIGATLESMFAVGKQRSRQVDYEGHTDTVFFGCWRRDAFDRFGLFDETLVRNQDDEHNLRIVRAGGKIWQSPGICAWQRPRSSFRMLFRQYFGYGYWKVPVIKKHRVPASARHLVPGLFVLIVLALPALALCWRPASLIWASLLTVYALGVLAAAARTAARAGWDLLPWLPAGFGTVHFAYGLGFLAGAIDHGVADGLIRKTAVGATLIGRRLDA
jgi:GT2 family glycosyltransferase